MSNPKKISDLLQEQFKTPIRQVPAAEPHFEIINTVPPCANLTPARPAPAYSFTKDEYYAILKQVYYQGFNDAMTDRLDNGKDFIDSFL